jgi:FkbM family methyltransferase
MRRYKLPNRQFVYSPDKISAIGVYREIYVANEYFRHGISIRDGDVVFDVGANIGLFCRLISEKARHLSIFAFEPTPPIFEALVANLKDIPATVRPYCVGLGEESTSAEITYYPRVSCDSSIVPFDWDERLDLHTRQLRQRRGAWILPERWLRAIVGRFLEYTYKAVKLPVTIEPLSKYIRKEGVEQIDLLKIDAENYERQVIAGIDDEHWDRIRAVVMEVHEHIVGGKGLLDETRKLLEDKGFKTAVQENSLYEEYGVYMLHANR